MKRVNTQQRISALEAQVEALRRFFLGKPDLEIDEKNWRKVRVVAKRSRQHTFRKFYGKG